MPLEAGARCLGQYRGAWYSGTVLEVSGDFDEVTLTWDPPHDRWGPAVLPKAHVKEAAPHSEHERELMQTIERLRKEHEAAAGHPLLQILPAVLFDAEGLKVNTVKHLAGCRVIAVLLVRLADPLSTELARRCRELCASLSARGAEQPAIVVFPLDGLLGSHASTEEQWAAFRACAPPSSLSVHRNNAAVIAAALDILTVCRVSAERDLPSLSLFTENGDLVTAAGAQALASDPAGERFPWGRSSQLSLFWALALLGAPLAGLALAYTAYRCQYCSAGRSSAVLDGNN